MSLTPGDVKSGYITPVVGVEGGKVIDYDRREHMVYWLQAKENNDEYENGTIYTMPYTGGNRTEFPSPSGNYIFCDESMPDSFLIFIKT